MLQHLGDWLEASPDPGLDFLIARLALADRPGARPMQLGPVLHGPLWAPASGRRSPSWASALLLAWTLWTLPPAGSQDEATAAPLHVNKPARKHIILQIVDARSGQPLADVRISVASHMLAMTDVHGQVQMELRMGPDRMLVFSHAGYRPYTLRASALQPVDLVAMMPGLPLPMASTTPVPSPRLQRVPSEPKPSAPAKPAAAPSRIPAGHGLPRMRRPAGRQSIPATVPSYTLYRVHSGDTLWGIARTQLGSGFRWPRLWRSNRTHVPNPRLIYPGQWLRIPVAASYRVQPGDSLWGIARAWLGNGDRWPLIWQLNRRKIALPRRIWPGQRLRLPAGKPT